MDLRYCWRKFILHQNIIFAIMSVILIINCVDIRISLTSEWGLFPLTSITGDQLVESVHRS